MAADLEVACDNSSMVAGCKATPLTPDNNPAPIDGALIITVVSGDGTFMQDASKPLDFDLVSGPTVGVTMYLIRADPDMTAAVGNIQGTASLTVTSAAASKFGFSAGTIKPKPKPVEP